MTTTINILKVTTPKRPLESSIKKLWKKNPESSDPPPLRRTVNGKRLMRFQSKLKKPPFSNSSDVVWPESILNKKC